MRLSFKELKQYSVETQSGVSLGHVHEIMLEDETQTIAQYAVRSFVFGHDYLVSRNQVIAFRDGKIIVDDAVKENLVNTPDVENPIPKAGPIQMRSW